MYRIPTIAATAALSISLASASGYERILQQLSKITACEELKGDIGKQFDLSDVTIKATTLGGIKGYSIGAIGYIETKETQELLKKRAQRTVALEYEHQQKQMGMVLETLIEDYKAKLSRAAWEDFSKGKTDDDITRLLEPRYGKRARKAFDEDYKNHSTLLLEFHSSLGHVAYNEAARDKTNDELVIMAREHLLPQFEKTYFRSRFIDDSGADALVALRKQGDFFEILRQAMETAKKEQKDITAVLEAHPVYATLFRENSAGRISYAFMPLNEITRRVEEQVNKEFPKAHLQVPLIFAPQLFGQLAPLWDNASKEMSFEMRANLACVMKSDLKYIEGTFPRLETTDMDLLMALVLGDHLSLSDKSPAVTYFNVEELRERK